MVLSYLKYNLQNPMGNKRAGTANVLPAVLSTWANLLSFKGSSSQYDLYKQQAKDYIDTARRNADLIKSKGEIALRNLEYKDKLARGTDLATAGAANGNMSGSNLDVVMQKEKVRKMDEATLKNNYTNQVMIEMSNGYAQAYNAYGALSIKAKGDRWGVLASILKGFEVYTQLQTRDATKIHSNVDSVRQEVMDKLEAEDKRQKATYNVPRKSEGVRLNGPDDMYVNESTNVLKLTSDTNASDDIILFE